jgi:predicted nucleic-acid-binding Zn-ribbon protein
MPKTQVTCPQCHSPNIVEVQQIFDLGQDPLAKQKLLNGAVNVIHCQTCGYSGMIGTPIVYHDPEKELLLTFFPPESNVPLNEQEKQLGPLINRVIDSLPAEKRKAYILQPQSMPLSNFDRERSWKRMA